MKFTKTDLHNMSWKYLLVKNNFGQVITIQVFLPYTLYINPWVKGLETLSANFNKFLQTLQR